VGEPDREVAAKELGYGSYRDKPDAWQKIWTYRRIRGRAAPATGPKRTGSASASASRITIRPATLDSTAP
jgi:hypothetical protein